ncbi:hypothetical protein LIER_10032 [Lithospermum erythrorhizon]|uniref:Uncharacterized protein n=1 Tax=Lithospermum erythrorhizon TaxID=34254 RepID=A0AAV3PJ55_LITER
MSLACIVCHGVESPSHSFRSYSVSSADEGRCSAISSCLTRRAAISQVRANKGFTSSKVTPQPIVPSNAVAGPPRLVRSRAVRRDWNFDEVVFER